MEVFNCVNINPEFMLFCIKFKYVTKKFQHMWVLTSYFSEHVQECSIIFPTKEADVTNNFSLAKLYQYLGKCDGNTIETLGKDAKYVQS